MNAQQSVYALRVSVIFDSVVACSNFSIGGQDTTFQPLTA